MENAFKRQKDEFKKRLNEFIMKHTDEMNPVFITYWKGEVEIGFSAKKYGFKLPEIIGGRVQNAVDLISEKMQREISIIFNSIYNK